MPTSGVPSCSPSASTNSWSKSRWSCSMGLTSWKLESHWMLTKQWIINWYFTQLRMWLHATIDALHSSAMCLSLSNCWRWVLKCLPNMFSIIVSTSNGISRMHAVLRHPPRHTPPCLVAMGASPKDADPAKLRSIAFAGLTPPFPPDSFVVAFGCEQWQSREKRSWMACFCSSKQHDDFSHQVSSWEATHAALNDQVLQWKSHNRYSTQRKSLSKSSI